jgi:hypothetical protein
MRHVEARVRGCGRHGGHNGTTQKFLARLGLHDGLQSPSMLDRETHVMHEGGNVDATRAWRSMTCTR